MPAIGNLDNRIANAHQLLTQDVERFCNSVVNQYSNLSKLFLDIVLYIVKLTNAQVSFCMTRASLTTQVTNIDELHQLCKEQRAKIPVRLNS
ncbi:ATP-binding cassette sub-family D member 3-like [Spea bombifrons]|uniref:ATP-binding cassette sub-family D member 3-like n=1 Tax=Spea bombifrons TaxID=233779 RepID=UPI00234AD4A9|nr:ATP-binding cassette sub-family D member 3-like [Spea bombifrons]